MPELDITVTCGQEPGPFPYSHCLAWGVSYDSSSDDGCTISCNTGGAMLDCCLEWDIENISPLEDYFLVFPCDGGTPFYETIVPGQRFYNYCALNIQPGGGVNAQQTGRYCPVSPPP